MSQPTNIANKGSAPAHKGSEPTVAKDCVVFYSAQEVNNVVVACAKSFGLKSKIGSRLIRKNARHQNSWAGFALSFSLGYGQEANEVVGFGVRYMCKLTSCRTDVPVVNS